MQAEGYYLFIVVLIGTHSGITALVATLTRIQPNTRYVGRRAQCNDRGTRCNDRVTHRVKIAVEERVA